MTRLEVALATCLALFVLVAPSAAQRSRSLPQPNQIELGSKPTHRFRQPLWNGQGADSLEAFRGRPVLIEFWSVANLTCVGSSVAQTLRLKEEFGDDLALIMVECSGKTEDSTDVASFALRNRWLGGNAVWTREVPFFMKDQALPRFALLNGEGELILRGDSTRLYSQLQDTIEREIKAGNRGPKDLPSSVARLWRDMGRGQYAKAFDEALVLVDQDGQDPEIIAAAAWLLRKGKSRLQSQLRRVEWMVANGHVLEAEKLAGQLAKGVRGREAIYLPGLEPIVELLESDEMKAEFTAARSLRKLESRLYKDGPSDRIARSLRKFAEKHAGTRCATRSTVLAKIATGSEGE